MSPDAKKEGLAADAKSFCDSLGNVFLMKKRDPQTRHLLEKAKSLIETLLAENGRLSASQGSGTPRSGRSAGGMGQLWVKLDELKRENEDLRRKCFHDRQGSPKSAGPGEVIIADLQRTKSENDCMKSQVEKLTKTVKELQTVNAALQDEYKLAKVALDSAQKAADKARHDYRTLEARFTTARTENDSLKSKLTSSVKPMVRVDNRVAETLSDQCRPSVVAVRYSTLESQQWVDAKEALEDLAHHQEKDITTFLCDALMTTMDISTEVYRNLERAVGLLFTRPVLAGAVLAESGDEGGEECTLPDELTDMLRSRCRQAVVNADTDAIGLLTKRRLDKEFRKMAHTGASNKAVTRYLQECARLTWQMCVQQPPMRMRTDDVLYDDEKHRLWWSCDQSRASKVDYFVWPVLYDYDHGNMLVKGCVVAS